MSLSAGTRLGPYEIVGLVGAGGMGEVYKARDTRLDRTVAIKVLPADISVDPDRRARFEREAKTIAGLTHPHICTLHDVGAHADSMFLVMEHLDGDTLARRLEKGPLSIERALTIGTEVADALTAAHRAGIIHRDLKPGNIMLTKSGVKLLDFGLAKLAADGEETAIARLVSAPTRTSPLTGEGVILGTLQYMAPEQLEGQEADVRSDIFAFGLVLYEMVTGHTAFAGKTHAGLISSILKDEPRPIAELQPLTPPLLDHIIGRCLAKDPDERWQSTSDLARELRWAGKSIETVRLSPSVARQSHRSRLMLGSAAVLAGLVIGILAMLLLAGFGSRSTDRPRDVVRALVSIAPAEHLQALPSDRTTTEGRPGRTTMAWSPDGRSIVFSAVQSGRQQLYRRAVDQLTATSIPGTEGASNPFFSPDGRWVGFWSGGALKKTSVDGGPATTICETSIVFGASWGPDDTIVFAQQLEGLWRVPATGGTPQSVTRPDRTKGELKYLLPQILPDGRTVLFTVTHTPHPTWADTEIVAQSLSTGERTVLVPGGADGRYVRTGHLLYLRQGTLMAVPFDLQGLKVAGGAMAVIADVMQAGHTPNEASESGAGQFSVSESGSLLYLPGGLFPDPERSLVWVSRTGAVEPLPLTPRAYLSPRLSQDGRRVVFWTQGDRKIWVYDLARGTLTKLPSEARNARAIWTPDGTRVTYGSATGGPENIFWQPADGSGPAERLTTNEYTNGPGSWSPDGQTLAFVENRPLTGYNIWLLPGLGDRRPRPLLQTRFAEAYPDFSPDGRQLAYASDESGRSEVWVQAYPGPGPRQQVSTDGGTAPAWSRDGRELFYTPTESVGGQATPTRMMAVPVTSRPTLTFGTPRMLFQGRYGASALIRGYDVTADGQRFLMVLPKERPPVNAAEMILVQNWLEELKRLVPAK